MPVPPAPDPNWFVDALTQTSDLVLVIDANADVVWVNDAVTQTLGHDPAESIGRSIADFLHPDDLTRAIEVVALDAAGAFDATPITPALYRARHADGSWRMVELNGASAVAGSDHVLVVGRTGSDLVLADELLEAITGGATVDAQVQLVLEMGRWRHPLEGYAIYYRDVDGSHRSASSEVPDVLRERGPAGTSPWLLDVPEEPVLVDLDPDLTDAVEAAGFTGCLAGHVPDPLHDDGARILIWTGPYGPTSAGHRYALSNMRRALRLVLQQRAQVHLLEQAARVDDLTRLASRARFFELVGGTGRADGHEAAHAGPAVLYVDLDGFKAVNDNHGHAAGDRVLRAAAARLRAVAPPGSEWARLGGDEFVLLVDRLESAGHAVEIARQVVAAFQEPIEINGTLNRVGASVGVAVGGPGEGADAVLEAADRALFEAKASGRSRWRLAGDDRGSDSHGL